MHIQLFAGIEVSGAAELFVHTQATIPDFACRSCTLQTSMHYEASGEGGFRRGRRQPLLCRYQNKKDGAGISAAYHERAK